MALSLYDTDAIRLALDGRTVQSVHIDIIASTITLTVDGLDDGDEKSITFSTLNVAEHSPRLHVKIESHSDFEATIS